MTPIQVVGIGLDGLAGLSSSVRQIVEQATLLVGHDRHLSYVADHPAEQIRLDNFSAGIDQIQQRLAHPAESAPRIVILTSGDPLFFGLGRLLLAKLPPDCLTFHPHPSSVQLAFNRIKVPWQDACLISAHGRSLMELTQALQQGADKIAVLTDPTHTPIAIAQLVISLNLPSRYQLWVCENLGGDTEKIQPFLPEDLSDQAFASLNVVILLRQSEEMNEALDLSQLPAFGLSDSLFLSFRDRPGLMTKREIRMLALGELSLQPQQVIWDIGAGTGSVSVEMARLSPQSQVYAIEKTAMGRSLIEQNCQRFQVTNVTPIHDVAPDALEPLPSPQRIFIGGSGGHLEAILNTCADRLQPGGVMVLALATLEHLATLTQWLERRSQSDVPWDIRLLQAQLARSVSVSTLTRFAPLNPVTLVRLQKPALPLAVQP